MEWEIVPREEQETMILVDYFERTINVYTTRKTVAERLQRKVGQPTKQLISNGKIYGVEYKRDLFDKDVAKFFSKMLIVGAFKSDEEIEQSSEETTTKQIN